MKKKRSKYTQEFKEEAVKLITEQGYQIAEAARNLGVNQTMLWRWKRDVERGDDPAAAQGGKSHPGRVNSPSEREYALENGA